MNAQTARFLTAFGPVAIVRARLAPPSIPPGFNPPHLSRSILSNFWRILLCAPHRVGGGGPSPPTFSLPRDTDGRYGENPNRLQHYYQFQVILKPSPDDLQDLYLESLEAIGIDPLAHDIRFVEDDWESPTLGAWGLGWEVWCDGMEVTQFTYFQQVGGIDCRPVSGELTYGLERLAMYVQGVENVYDLDFNGRRRQLRRRVPAGRARVLGLQLRGRRHRAAVPPLRGCRGRVPGAARRGRRWPCRPTTSASRPAICSTCWTRAA